jgi:hypothetical protein
MSDPRLQIPFWNLRFAICNPEGHGFAMEGLFLAFSGNGYCGIRPELTSSCHARYVPERKIRRGCQSVELAMHRSWL